MDLPPPPPPQDDVHSLPFPPKLPLPPALAINPPNPKAPEEDDLPPPPPPSDPATPTADLPPPPPPPPPGAVADKDDLPPPPSRPVSTRSAAPPPPPPSDPATPTADLPPPPPPAGAVADKDDLPPPPPRQETERPAAPASHLNSGTAVSLPQDTGVTGSPLTSPPQSLVSGHSSVPPPPPLSATTAAAPSRPGERGPELGTAERMRLETAQQGSVQVNTQVDDMSTNSTADDSDDDEKPSEAVPGMTRGQEDRFLRLLSAGLPFPSVANIIRAEECDPAGFFSVHRPGAVWATSDDDRSNDSLSLPPPSPPQEVAEDALDSKTERRDPDKMPTSDRPASSDAAQLPPPSGSIPPPPAGTLRPPPKSHLPPRIEADEGRAPAETGGGLLAAIRGFDRQQLRRGENEATAVPPQQMEQLISSADSSRMRRLSTASTIREGMERRRLRMKRFSIAAEAKHSHQLARAAVQRPAAVVDDDESDWSIESSSDEGTSGRNHRRVTGNTVGRAPIASLVRSTPWGGRDGGSSATAKSAANAAERARALRAKTAEPVENKAEDDVGDILASVRQARRKEKQERQLKSGDNRPPQPVIVSKRNAPPRRRRSLLLKAGDLSAAVASAEQRISAQDAPEAARQQRERRRSVSAAADALLPVSRVARNTGRLRAAVLATMGKFKSRRASLPSASEVAHPDAIAGSPGDTPKWKSESISSPADENSRTESSKSLKPMIAQLLAGCDESQPPSQSVPGAAAEVQSETPTRSVSKGQDDTSLVVAVRDKETASPCTRKSPPPPLQSDAKVVAKRGVLPTSGPREASPPHIPPPVRPGKFKASQLAARAHRRAKARSEKPVPAAADLTPTPAQPSSPLQVLESLRRRRESLSEPAAVVVRPVEKSTSVRCDDTPQQKGQPEALEMLSLPPPPPPVPPPQDAEAASEQEVREALTAASAAAAAPRSGEVVQLPASRHATRRVSLATGVRDSSTNGADQDRPEELASPMKQRPGEQSSTMGLREADEVKQAAAARYATLRVAGEVAATLALPPPDRLRLAHPSVAAAAAAVAALASTPADAPLGLAHSRELASRRSVMSVLNHLAERDPSAAVRGVALQRVCEFTAVLDPGHSASSAPAHRSATATPNQLATSDAGTLVVDDAAKDLARKRARARAAAFKKARAVARATNHRGGPSARFPSPSPPRRREKRTELALDAALSLLANCSSEKPGDGRSSSGHVGALKAAAVLAESSDPSKRAVAAAVLSLVRTQRGELAPAVAARSVATALAVNEKRVAVLRTRLSDSTPGNQCSTGEGEEKEERQRASVDQDSLEVQPLPVKYRGEKNGSQPRRREQVDLETELGSLMRAFFPSPSKKQKPPSSARIENKAQTSSVSSAGTDDADSVAALDHVAAGQSLNLRRWARRRRGTLVRPVPPGSEPGVKSQEKGGGEKSPKLTRKELSAPPRYGLHAPNSRIDAYHASYTRVGDMPALRESTATARSTEKKAAHTMRVALAAATAFARKRSTSSSTRPSGGGGGEPHHDTRLSRPEPMDAKSSAKLAPAAPSRALAKWRAAAATITATSAFARGRSAHDYGRTRSNDAPGSPLSAERARLASQAEYVRGRSQSVAAAAAQLEELYNVAACGSLSSDEKASGGTGDEERVSEGEERTPRLRTRWGSVAAHYLQNEGDDPTADELRAYTAHLSRAVTAEMQTARLEAVELSRPGRVDNAQSSHIARDRQSTDTDGGLDSASLRSGQSAAPVEELATLEHGRSRSDFAKAPEQLMKDSGPQHAFIDLDRLLTAAGLPGCAASLRSALGCSSLSDLEQHVSAAALAHAVARGDLRVVPARKVLAMVRARRAQAGLDGSDVAGDLPLETAMAAVAAGATGTIGQDAVTLSDVGRRAGNAPPASIVNGAHGYAGAPGVPRSEAGQDRRDTGSREGSGSSVAHSAGSMALVPAELDRDGVQTNDEPGHITSRRTPWLPAYAVGSVVYVSNAQFDGRHVSTTRPHHWVARVLAVPALPQGHYALQWLVETAVGSNVYVPTHRHFTAPAISLRPCPPWRWDAVTSGAICLAERLPQTPQSVPARVLALLRVAPAPAAVHATLCPDRFVALLNTRFTPAKVGPESPRYWVGRITSSPELPGSAAEASTSALSTVYQLQWFVEVVDPARPGIRVVVATPRYFAAPGKVLILLDAVRDVAADGRPGWRVVGVPHSSSETAS